MCDGQKDKEQLFVCSSGLKQQLWKRPCKETNSLFSFQLSAQSFQRDELISFRASVFNMSICTIRIKKWLLLSV